jgi:hypothetical protein
MTGQIWIGFVWLRKSPAAGSCGYNNEIFGLIIA